MIYRRSFVQINCEPNLFMTQGHGTLDTIQLADSIGGLQYSRDAILGGNFDICPFFSCLGGGAIDFTVTYSSLF